MQRYRANLVKNSELARTAPPGHTVQRSNRHFIHWPPPTEGARDRLAITARYRNYAARDRASIKNDATVGS